jgi:uncharacterized protein (TIGR03089 family)
VQPAEVLAARARRDGAGPFVTFYDDATGERVELSTITTLNWVAKVTALLRDELWIEPGSEVGIDLPLHWQTLVVTLATWSAGAVPVTLGGQVAFVAADGRSTAEETIALSLRPLGGRIVGDLPPRWQDFAAVVPGMPDAFAPVTPPLTLPTPPELPSGARVLATVWEPGMTLLAPLACGGSEVLVRNPRAELVDLATSERVTHTFGCEIEGLPRLD